MRRHLRAKSEGVVRGVAKVCRDTKPVQGDFSVRNGTAAGVALMNADFHGRHLDGGAPVIGQACAEAITVRLLAIIGCVRNGITVNFNDWKPLHFRRTAKEIEVNKITILVGIMLAAMAASAAASPGAGKSAASADALTKTVSGLDTGLFDAFNHCDAPGELQKHAGYLAKNLEFYHDKGGVTWTRAAYLANTKKNACGHFRRELVPGSLEIFPIKDFGAIEQGWHKFCDLKTDQCFGEAQFLIAWRHQAGKWQATRIFSYGHRPIASGSAETTSDSARNRDRGS